MNTTRQNKRRPRTRRPRKTPVESAEASLAQPRLEEVKKTDPKPNSSTGTLSKGNPTGKASAIPAGRELVNVPKPATSPKNIFSQREDSPCLLEINGCKLDGYAFDTIRHIGQGFAPGINTAITIDKRPHVVPVVYIKFFARTQAKNNFLFGFTLLMDKLVEPPTVAVVTNSDLSVLREIFKFPPADTGKLRSGNGPSRSHDKSLTDAEVRTNSHPPLVRVSASIPRDAILEGINYDFLDSLDKQDPDIARLASAAAEQVLNSHDPVLSVTAYVGGPATGKIVKRWPEVTHLVNTDHSDDTKSTHAGKNTSDLTHTDAVATCADSPLVDRDLDICMFIE
ncbi:hypothetical protein CDD80_5334 [Ophiocordyceps camponoti-rufipedis]|uniref:Uncharacterized protein n=1 Tax=Ophiocordyceps camponoti-rufipedis TaxID=2004952 RepID=A0A2C5ZHH2_9HYPO|nr:hypothetical protein CDD80_5334 [Ophiocordyceps camponoti-rufipedis]